MEQTIQLKPRLNFKNCPPDWSVLNVAIDWAGEPLVLFDEGKQPQPQRELGMDALVQWMNTPARAHHLVYWTGTAISGATFINTSKHLSTYHIQPFGDGWLLADSRGGEARVFDRTGSRWLNTLVLGDASKDIQTTSAGHIWVSYFDEGVFGGGIGQNGLVCFDASGNPIFRYAEFAEKNGLPFISDCYALNVDEGDVRVCYYTDFPLVWLRNFNVYRVWQDFGSTKAFAIRGQRIVRFPAYSKPYLMSRTFDNSGESMWTLTAPDGRNLSVLEGKPREESHVPFSIAARGGRIYAWTESALFEAERI